jgi:hypothetical protein
MVHRLPRRVSIAELEAAVRASWDREAIAIYADHLQIGDPRGELVAIDLRIDDGDAGADVLARRAELIEEWFGAALPPGIVRYGFFDADASGMGPDSQLAIALCGPGARFIRSVKLAGPHAELGHALRELAAEPRPWLTALTIRHWHEQAAPVLDGNETARLFVNLPALSSLVLEGRRILAASAHPAVEQLRVTGFDAIDLTSAIAWPRVRELDFAFHCQYAAEHADPPIDTIAKLLVRRSLPALTTLDLSRNEPGATEPRSLGGAIVIGAFFMRFADHATLATLRLPSLRHEAAIVSVERTLAQLPALREVAVWAPAPRLPKHPTATIREVPIHAVPPGPKRLA